MICQRLSADKANERNDEGIVWKSLVGDCSLALDSN